MSSEQSKSPAPPSSRAQSTPPRPAPPSSRTQSTPPRSSSSRRSSPTLHIAQVVAALNLPDPKLAERMLMLGFDAETASVLYLLPVIQVAWANGSVSRAERAKIIRILRLREIPEGSRAWQMCETLLDSRPTDAFVHHSRQLLQAVLKSKGRAIETQLELELIALCLDVAEVSGGIFGFGGRVSRAEEEAIREIATSFGPEALSELNRQLRT